MVALITLLLQQLRNIWTNESLSNKNKNYFK